MKIGIIFAQSSNNVIGNEGKLPWRLPEDLEYFQKSTLGKPVIMGRRTWESLPWDFKPLVDRLNVVVSEKGMHDISPATCVRSLPLALETCKHYPFVWVIGGVRLFAEALHLADVLSVTTIHQKFDGDTFAPSINYNDWEINTHKTDTSKLGLKFSITLYTRKASNERID